MARFNMELPTDIMRDVKRIHDNADQIFGAMTKAGAEVAARNARAGAPSELRDTIRLTKTYKTPSDDGINTKVYFSGYLPFKNGQTSFTTRGGGHSGKQYTTTKGVPAAFIAAVTEFGTSQRYTNEGYNRGAIKRKPFFRKAFKKNEIEKAMLDAQKKASGGLLEDE